MSTNQEHPNSQEPLHEIQEDNPSAFSQEPPYSSLNHSNIPMKHSGLGITSFVIFFVGLLSTIFLIVLASTSLVSVIGDYSDPSTLDEQAIQDMIESFDVQTLMGIGIGFLVIILLHLIGGIIGIVSLFQKQRKRVFGIIGTVLNMLVIGGIGILFLIGLALGSNMVA